MDASPDRASFRYQQNWPSGIEDDGFCVPLIDEVVDVSGEYNQILKATVFGYEGRDFACCCSLLYQLVGQSMLIRQLAAELRKGGCI